MERFHVIDDAAVILRSKGVFRQAKVFRRGTELFAAHGSGFIRLLSSGGTTLPAVSWLETEPAFRTDNLGRPVWIGG